LGGRSGIDGISGTGLGLSQTAFIAHCIFPAGSIAKRPRWERRLGPAAVQGVPVPVTEDADIVLPAYLVLAHATFSDATIVTDGGAPAGAATQ
jgi:hypothetical protein